MSQTFPVNGFKRLEQFSEFDEPFLKNFNEKSKEVYFLEFNIQYPEELHELHNDLHWKLKNH